MSGLVFDETKVIPTDVKQQVITIDRIESINSGVRIWYVILSTEGVYYQRWSMLMNPTDEIMLLAKPGDVLSIDYVEDYVEDPIHEQFQPFGRLLILNATVV